MFSQRPSTPFILPGGCIAQHGQLLLQCVARLPPHPPHSPLLRMVCTLCVRCIFCVLLQRVRAWLFHFSRSVTIFLIPRPQLNESIHMVSQESHARERPRDRERQTETDKQTQTDTERERAQKHGEKPERLGRCASALFLCLLGLMWPLRFYFSVPLPSTCRSSCAGKLQPNFFVYVCAMNFQPSSQKTRPK